MKKILFILSFLPLFAFGQFNKKSKVTAPDDCYMAVFLAAVGQKTEKIGNKTYMVTNGQPINLQTMKLDPKVYPAYITTTDVEAQGVAELLKEQPKTDPYVVLCRRVNDKTLKQMQKKDPTRLSVAYIIQNWGDKMTLSQFINWQKKANNLSAFIAPSSSALPNDSIANVNAQLSILANVQDLLLKKQQQQIDSLQNIQQPAGTGIPLKSKETQKENPVKRKDNVTPAIKPPGS